MDTAQLPRMFLRGRNPQVFCWFKCISSQEHVAVSGVSQGTTGGLQLSLKPPEMFVRCCMGECSRVPRPPCTSTSCWFE